MTERMKPELMTCHDIVATGRYPYTGKLGILSREDEQKVDEAMEAVHAQELGDRDFNAISDGQRQRVLLARAICQNRRSSFWMNLHPSWMYVTSWNCFQSEIWQRRGNHRDHVALLRSDLAEKLQTRSSAQGDRIAHYGKPETIFKEDIIKELYGIDNGYFDSVFGSLEL